MKYYKEPYNFEGFQNNDFWKEENLKKNVENIYFNIITLLRSYFSNITEYEIQENRLYIKKIYGDKVDIETFKKDNKDDFKITNLNKITDKNIIDKLNKGISEYYKQYNIGYVIFNFSDVVTFRDKITAMSLAKKLGFLKEENCSEKQVEQAIGAVVALVLGSTKFTNWLDNTIKSGMIYDIYKIIIEDVDLFAAPCKNEEGKLVCYYKNKDKMVKGVPNIGFIKMHVMTKSKSPGIVLLRGDAVGFLLYYKTDNNEIKTILTHQDRVPTGKKLYEIPAGMLDGSTNYLNKIAAELKEEVGVTLNKKELYKNKIDVKYGDNEFFYTSQGLLEEKLKLCTIEITDSDAIKEIEEYASSGKNLGNTEEGESLTLKIVPLDDLPYWCDDLKSLVCWNQLKNNLSQHKTTEIIKDWGKGPNGIFHKYLEYLIGQEGKFGKFYNIPSNLESLKNEINLKSIKNIKINNNNDKYHKCLDDLIKSPLKDINYEIIYIYYYKVPVNLN